MGDPVSVDTDRMGMATPEIAHLADLARGIHSTLLDAIEGLGECWGGDDDPTGKVFAAQYKPAVDQLVKGIKDTWGVLTSAGDGLVTMVKGFTATETENIKTARQLAPPEAKPAPRP